ncbi:MAG: AAA family ATPase, partial [Candidatus Pacearchaeota archaeon]
MRKPYLIIIDGPMGAGKTTVAQLLQKKLHGKKGVNALISLDKLKNIASGYKLDSKLHLSLASDIGAGMAKEYLKRDYNVIVEKAFTQSKYLKSFLKPFSKKANILIYQIEAPFDLRLKRIGGRDIKYSKKTPLNKIKRNTKNYDELKY